MARARKSIKKSDIPVEKAKTIEEVGSAKTEHLKKLSRANETARVESLAEVPESITYKIHKHLVLKVTKMASGKTFQNVHGNLKQDKTLQQRMIKAGLL